MMRWFMINWSWPVYHYQVDGREYETACGNVLNGLEGLDPAAYESKYVIRPTEDPPVEDQCSACRSVLRKKARECALVMPL